MTTQAELNFALQSSEHGFDDYDVVGHTTLRRVCVPQGIRKGDIFNVYFGISSKGGAKWLGSLEVSLTAWIAENIGTVGGHYVLNEHTLCYSQVGTSFYGVLAGKPQLGGHDWKNGPISVVSTDTLRPATLEDFEFYRVCPKGHIA
jgi:hypothetical protein